MIPQNPHRATIWCISYWDALIAIWKYRYYAKSEEISIGDDDGDAVEVGGLLSKMELTYPIRIHSVNPIEIEKLRSAIIGNALKEVDPRKNVCIWIDHEANEPNGFFRLDTVNKVKNCVLWCQEHGWAIGCIDAAEQIERERMADGGSVEDLMEWLRETGKYNLFRRH